MKKSRILVPAMAVLIMSTAASITGTVAWFSANNTIAVTGMKVTTSVSSNLYVASSRAGVDNVADTAFKNGLNQVVTGELQPVSSINGTTFFYSDTANADGTTASAAYTAYDKDKQTFGYRDQVFELKAINSGTTAANVELNRLNITYNGGVNTKSDAFRVAIFIQDIAEEGDPAKKKTPTTGADTGLYNAIATDADAIYGAAGSVYQTSGEAVKTTTTTASVVHYSTAIAKEVAPGETDYFKVTVRMWLEGEDKKCTNTDFLGLDGAWALDLGFILDNGATNTPPTVFTNAGNVDLAKDGNKLTASLVADLNQTAASYKWYKVGTVAAIDGETAESYTATATGDYYCEITTTKGNVYQSEAKNVTIA